MADKQNRRRRPRGKKGDTAVTTGGAGQQQGQQQRAQANQRGGKQQGGKKGGAKQQPKAQPKAQSKAQGKAKAQTKGQQQQGGKGKKQPQKAKKQERQQKNKQNANRAKKGSKDQRQKVSEDKARQKKKQEEKQRLNLILRAKFQNPTKKNATQTETAICQYLVNLEASNKDFKDDLRALGIVAAREIPVANQKKAVVVFVPFVQHAAWQKIQDRVTRELEKKFSGQDVLFVAQRKVMKLNQIKNNFPRPRNQTITSVHEQILDDIVYPTRIVGKRTRFRVGGKRVLKVLLDPKDSKDIEPKIATYEAVYKKLTKKNVKFMFPRYVI